VDEPRPQPPASETSTVNDGRNEAARQEARHANSLDDENVRERSLLDDPNEVEDDEDLDEDLDEDSAEDSTGATEDDERRER
jgi:hypothetical protein